jgi:enolase
MSVIKSIDGLTTLNSCGGPAAEISVTLESGFQGHGSGARAAARGQRESKDSCIDALPGMSVPTAFLLPITKACSGKDLDQHEFDEIITSESSRLGSDVAAAASFAFARARAAESGRSLLEYIGHLSGRRPRLPSPLINVISGGIHAKKGMNSFQQVMICPTIRQESSVQHYREGIELYGMIEKELARIGRLRGYAASSGMLTEMDGDAAVAWVAAFLDAHAQEWSIAIDVAAEHIWDESKQGYMWGGVHLGIAEWQRKLEALCEQYALAYIEDPYLPAHRAAWIELTESRRKQMLVVGDDLFASQSRWLAQDQCLANAILLKPNQAGTLTALVQVAKRATESGLLLGASHRTCETEDTSVCDLAVALGVSWLKLGGPRRGDRVSRFNRIFGLSRQLEQVKAVVGLNESEARDA